MSTEFEVVDVSEGYTRLEIEATLPGAADEVFEHFTDPRKLERWWPQEALVDARPGGSYQFSWPTMGWTLFGTYKEVVPVPVSPGVGGRPKGEGRLVFTWKWEQEPELPEREVEIRIVPAKDGDLGPRCHMLLVHRTYDDSDQDQDDRENHFEGWEHFLGKLADVLVDPEAADEDEELDWGLDD